MVDVDLASEHMRCFDPPAAKPRETDDEARLQGRPVDRWSELARTIETGIIPRLLISHRDDLRQKIDVVEAMHFDASTPETLARIVLAQHAEAALDFVHRLVSGGLPLEAVYLDLLAPAARWLGDAWMRDELSFMDVTLALSRLQRLMRQLASAVAPPTTEAPAGRRVLLATTPSEQHVFGLLMLEEFLRRDGWQVECLPGASRAQIVASVKRNPPWVVGFSIASDEWIGELKGLISELRDLTRAHDTLFMVGGRYFVEHPEMVSAVGANFTAIDGSQAIRHIHGHLSDDSPDLRGP